MSRGRSSIPRFLVDAALAVLVTFAPVLHLVTPEGARLGRPEAFAAALTRPEDSPVSPEFPVPSPEPEEPPADPLPLPLLPFIAPREVRVALVEADAVDGKNVREIAAEEVFTLPKDDFTDQDELFFTLASSGHLAELAGNVAPPQPVFSFTPAPSEDTGVVPAVSSEVIADPSAESAPSPSPLATESIEETSVPEELGTLAVPGEILPSGEDVPSEAEQPPSDAEEPPPSAESPAEVPPLLSWLRKIIRRATAAPSEDVPPVLQPVTVTLRDARGEELPVTPVLSEEDQGRVIRIPDAAAVLHPGTYELVVGVVAGDEILEATRDFTWGVLALNVLTSPAAVGVPVTIGMAVLDDHGRTVCDADVLLTVTAPDGTATTLSTNDGTIRVAGTCAEHSVTDAPDYEATFIPARPGEHALAMTAMLRLASGELATRTLARSLTVEEGGAPPALTVRREGATRIYPRSPYTMRIHLNAEVPFNGTVEERVPGSFIISEISGGEHFTLREGNTHRITWTVSLAQGESAALAYTYDAPDVSPELYLLGPLIALTDGAVVYQEPHGWQIAADAAKTWDGGGADSNWSTAANWSGDTVPVTTDSITFDATSTKSVTIDNVGTWTGGTFSINTGYTGTITQSVTMTTGNFSQADGTFSGGSANIDTNGTWALSGGTLTATSGTWFVSSTFTISGGTFTHNSGTVTFDGSSATVTPSTPNFNHVQLTGIGATKTIADSNTLTVVGTLTLTDGLISQTTIPAAGSVAAQGGLTQASTFDGGTGRIEITGTASQTFTGTATTSAGGIPDIEIDKSGGTLTFSGTIRANNDWTYTAGTLDATTNDSTVVFPANQTITGSHTLDNVTFSGAGVARTMANSNTLTVAGTLTLTDGTINQTTIPAEGSVAAQAAITQESTFDGGTGRIEITGSGSPTFTGSATTTAGSLPNMEIDKSGGTLTLSGTIRTTRSWTYTTGTISAGTSTVVFVPSSTTPTITGSHTLNAVTIDSNAATTQTLTVASGTTLTVSGALLADNTSTGAMVLTGGTIAAQGDVTTDSTVNSGPSATTAITLSGGSSQSLNIAGLPIGTFTVNKSVGSTATLAAALSANGTGQDLTITSGTLDLAGFNLTVNDVFTLGASGTLQLQGGETVSTIDTVTAASTVIYNGTGSFTTALAAGNTYSNLTFNGSGGVWEPNGAVTVSGTLTLTAGTFDLDGQNLTNTGGSFVNNSTLRLQGGETLTGFTNDTDTGTVEYDGTTSFTGLAAGNTYNNLTFNGTGGTWTMSAALTVNGTLTLTAGTLASNGQNVTTPTFTVSGGTFTGSAGTVDVNGVFTLSSGTYTAPNASGSFTVSGNFTHSGGTFTHNSGTVTLDGTDQTISGTSTFNNLTKTVTTARTLTYPASVTTTVAGTWTMQGASGALLSLRSSTSGTQWSIDPQGTRTISYLDVRDSNNVNGTSIATAGNNITDSGNNTGWSFFPTAPTNCKGTAQSSTSIKWEWTDNATDETGFRLQDSSGNLIKEIATANTINYTETGLTKGTAYARQIRAYNAGGNSSAASCGTVTTKESAPTASTLKSPSSAAILTTLTPTFTFTRATDDDDGIDTYDLRIDAGTSGAKTFSFSSPSAFSQTAITGATVTATEDLLQVALTKSLTEGVHTWDVRATDNGKNVSDSKQRTLTLDITKPLLSAITVAPSTGGTADLTTTSQVPTFTLSFTDSVGLSETTLLFEKRNFLLGEEVGRDQVLSVTRDLSGTADQISTTPSSPLSAGQYVLTIMTEDTAGNQSTSEKTLAILTAPTTVDELEEAVERGETPTKTPTEFSLQDLEKQAKIRRVREAENLRAFLLRFLPLDVLSGLDDALGRAFATLQEGLRTFAANVQARLAAAVGFTGDQLARLRALTVATREIVRARELAGEALLRRAFASLTESEFARLRAFVRRAHEDLALASGITIDALRENFPEFTEEQLAALQAAITLPADRLAEERRSALADLDVGLPRLAGRLVVAGQETFGWGRRLRIAARRNRFALARANEQRMDVLVQPVVRLGRSVGIGARVALENFRGKYEEPLAITDVAVTTLEPTRAVVSWETNRVTRGKVNYGPSISYGEEVFVDTFAVMHTAQLTNLTPRTKYYFEVLATDLQNVQTFDAYYGFTTPE